MVIHRGGCHCGRVRFEVAAPADVEVSDCNCSVCSQLAYLHLLVPRERFTLLSGADALSTYTFNTHVAQHYFCSHCGVKSFYVPRTNPAGVSVNVRCLSRDTIKSMTITPFDGREWEAAAASLT